MQAGQTKRPAWREGREQPPRAGAPQALLPPHPSPSHHPDTSPGSPGLPQPQAALCREAEPGCGAAPQGLSQQSPRLPPLPSGGRALGSARGPHPRGARGKGGCGSPGQGCGRTGHCAVGQHPHDLSHPGPVPVLPLGSSRPQSAGDKRPGWRGARVLGASLLPGAAGLQPPCTPAARPQTLNPAPCQRPALAHPRRHHEPGALPPPGPPRPRGRARRRSRAGGR